MQDLLPAVNFSPIRIGDTPILLAIVSGFLCRIVPVQIRDSSVAIFVSVTVAVVLIECKIGVGSRIDTHLRQALLLVCALNALANRNDGPGAHKQRESVYGCADLNRLAAV